VYATHKQGVKVLFSPIWMAKHALTKQEVNESSIFEHAAVSAFNHWIIQSFANYVGKIH
jgi:hypothetical protein